MKEHFKKIIEAVGEDTQREGLLKTPERAAKAFAYLTKGYNEDIKTVVNNAVFSSDMDEMVIVKNIELFSLCEHHLLPFFGSVHVAYVPRGKVLGLSKIARIVEIFAKRLQIQENLTMQIAKTIEEATGAKGVGVVMTAKHMCMMMRGVEKQQSEMTTSCMLGLFRKDAKTRSEFLSLIK